MEIGTQITLLREHKGISREYMSDALGIHVNTYKNIEYGKRIPDVLEIQKIAEILDVDPVIFLPGSKSHLFNNIHNSPGTGIGNQVINDKDLISCLNKTLEKLILILDREIHHK